MDYKLLNNSAAAEIAGELLKVGAVKLNLEHPFTWSSGWKSPIYCDNRITLSYPALRKRIMLLLCQAIKENYPEVNAIAGVATAGIPQGALIAQELDLPFLYVRSKPKGHGMENLIEGRLVPGQKVVVVEDLISTGGSSLKAIESLKENGAIILGLISIFNYGFDHAEKNCADAHVNVCYLSDYPVLIEQALAAGIVQESEVKRLQDWRKDPANWG